MQNHMLTAPEIPVSLCLNYAFIDLSLEQLLTDITNYSGALWSARDIFLSVSDWHKSKETLCCWVKHFNHFKYGALSLWSFKFKDSILVKNKNQKKKALWHSKMRSINVNLLIAEKLDFLGIGGILEWIVCL